MIRSLVALSLAVATGPALAQDYNRQDVVRGLCQPDGCDEFTILAADRFRAGGDGTLLKTRIQTFHSSRAGRQERRQEDGYVYCSPNRPAIMAEENGKTMAFFLAPFATLESRESVRKNANFHALYFAFCHGREAGKAAVHDLAGVARSHGYRVALEQSRLVPLARAEDVLTAAGAPGEPAPVQARQGEPPMRAPVEARRERPPVDARWERPPADGWRERPPAEAMYRDPPARLEPGRAPTRMVEQEDEGLLAGARRLTNRAFDALDEMGDWVSGRR
jgi:hypothetical protein